MQKDYVVHKDSPEYPIPLVQVMVCDPIHMYKNAELAGLRLGFGDGIDPVKGDYIQGIASCECPATRPGRERIPCLGQAQTLYVS